MPQPARPPVYSPYSRENSAASTSSLLTPTPQSSRTQLNTPLHAAHLTSSSSLRKPVQQSPIWGDGMGSRSATTSKYALVDLFTYSGMDGPESDDYLHNPDPRRDKRSDMGGTFFTYRGITNLGCLALIVIGMLALLFGYPLISHFTTGSRTFFTASLGLGGKNSSGPPPLPVIPGVRQLIDPDTPDEAKSIPSYYDPTKTLNLIFSDEFNTDGRSFYSGDDPFWEALDLNYWQTGDLEWYDPAAITTKNGFLEITLSQKQTHGLNYQGGMLTTWNNFCFQGGIVETSAVLPGSPDVTGFWPSVWTMGNLGRVGYGATTDGLWPYSYDTCDVGTVENQTYLGQPEANLEPGAGDKQHDNAISFLPGQRLSRCTCPGESHPGPAHSDGTYVGRAAPEIDVFEALATTAGHGNVSQSAQFAPFNWGYEWPEDGNMVIDDPTITSINGYKGGIYQQAVSGLSATNASGYELTDNIPIKYAMEYVPGVEEGRVTWVNNGQRAWTVLASGLVADPKSNISQRIISEEPMYLITNFGMSPSFVRINFDQLTFPATMRLDYIRVYQDPTKSSIGCDPIDHPTAAYINTYIDSYNNPNLTTWKQFGQSYPRNKFLGQC